MSAEFDVEEAGNIVDPDDKTETVSNVTKLISLSWYSRCYGRSCLRLMTSRDTEICLMTLTI